MNEEKEYTLLFNGITDIIQELQAMAARLQGLQCRAEECYIEKADTL